MTTTTREGDPKILIVSNRGGVLSLNLEDNQLAHSANWPILLKLIRYYSTILAQNLSRCYCTNLTHFHAQINQRLLYYFGSNWAGVTVLILPIFMLKLIRNYVETGVGVTDIILGEYDHIIATGWFTVHLQFYTSLFSWLGGPILKPFEWVNGDTGWFILRYNTTWYMTRLLPDSRGRTRLKFWFTLKSYEIWCESKSWFCLTCPVLQPPGHIPSSIIP